LQGLVFRLDCKTTRRKQSLVKGARAGTRDLKYDYKRFLHGSL